MYCNLLLKKINKLQKKKKKKKKKKTWWDIKSEDLAIYDFRIL